MAADTPMCSDCNEPLHPIRLIDRGHMNMERDREYTLPNTKRGFWSGEYPQEGPRGSLHVLPLWSHQSLWSSEGEVKVLAHYCVFVALLVGCGGADNGRGVTITDLRLDESNAPLPFVVALHNDSDDPAEIQGVSVNITGKTLISRPEDANRIHDGFDFEVEFDPNHPAEVAANADGVACGFLVWTLPPDSPPMIAVVTGEFRVRADGATLTTEPISLVLQSQEGLLEGDLIADDSRLAGEQAKQVLEVLSCLPGRKSEGFERLVRQLSDRGAEIVN